MLFLSDPKAGFRAGEHAVGDERDFFRVIAHARILVVPVGHFDDYLAFGIDGFRRFDDEVFRHLAHGFKAVLCPGFSPLGLDVVIGLAVKEVVVVEEDFIEMAGGQFRGFPGEIAVLRIGVVKALVTIGFAEAISKAAAHLHTLVLVEFLEFVQAGFIYQRVVAHDLDVDFVDLEIAGQGGPGSGGVGIAVHEALHGSLNRIGGDDEALVMALGLNGADESSDGQKNGRQLKVSHRN